MRRPRAALWPVLAWLWMWTTGCGSDELLLIPGTTTRVGPVKQADNTELTLDIFREITDCVDARIADDDAPVEVKAQCLPHVDRARGEVRVGYRFLKDEEPIPLPVSKDHMTVIHQGTIVQDDNEGQSWTIIPHDPHQVNQLYILLIDGSSSMSELAGPRRTRMDQVKQALRLRDVQQAFFPDEIRTGVVLMQFTDGEPQPVGGQLEILTTRRDYVDAVSQLRVLSGFTHLYESISFAAGPLLGSKSIERFVDQEDMAVTIIALTDGFNNMRSSDRCSDNAPRLEILIQQLEEMRTSRGARLGQRPRVYTVGLGRPLQVNFELPPRWRSEVRPRQLCGRFANQRIDGDLERRGIDNASLSWIARAGSGEAFVKQGRDGLGEAFRGAAALRYDWFEVRYRVDPFFLRRAFTTKLRLKSYHTAEAVVGLHPSAWLDAPPGREGDDGWTLPQKYRHTMVVLTPAVGLLIALGYLGGALFNTRRALFGRVRRKPTGGGDNGAEAED